MLISAFFLFVQVYFEFDYRIDNQYNWDYKV